ncbi:MAG: DHH family phosphoesterase [Candidatus Thorarchaeota archaeon]|jgi:oligoribonuclease NrnB/cAMP/cGMP phosphodiesterase (DHH superfamily)
MSSTTPTNTKTIDALLSISHDKDVDGLHSAAIVRRYAKSKGLKHDVILTDYGGFERVFSKVAAFRNTLIIVTDLGMDESELDKVASGLKRAISQGCRIVWLDHHQWSDNAAKTILSLGNKPVLKVNHDFCAAEITFKVLMPRDEISKELARIAHDTDFNLRELDVANALTDALSVIRFGALDRREDLTEALLPLLTSLADEGIKGVWDDSAKRFKDSLLSKKVEHYRKERLKKMKKALAGHCDVEVHDRLVRVVEMPSGVTTTDMGTFLASAENLYENDQAMKVADLLITMSQGGMLGFRRGTEKVLCNAAAKLFNGGGHPYAAGGEYGMYDDFSAACDDIALTLSKNKDWLA